MKYEKILLFSSIALPAVVLMRFLQLFFFAMSHILANRRFKEPTSKFRRTYRQSDRSAVYLFLQVASPRII